MSEEENRTELTDFIKDVKKQVKDSEDPRKKGFWIGSTAVELEVDAVSEKKGEVGVKIWVLHGNTGMTKKKGRKITIKMVTQFYPSYKIVRDIDELEKALGCGYVDPEKIEEKCWMLKKYEQ